MLLAAQYERELDKRLEAEREFLGNDYDTLDDKELHSDEEPVEFFYLWETHQETFEIYRIIRQWISEGDLSSVIPLVLKSADKRCLDHEKLLTDLPLIHYGFQSVISPAQPDQENKQFPECEE